MYSDRPRPTPTRTATPRRGVTLVEMLVAVALLVLMMTVIVQVFKAATDAVSASRTYQELDSSLRQLDGTIRNDLQNLTARLTPPLDPSKNLGYFEYIENSFADNQGEDTDDCLRLTVKAPEGQLFNGRMYTSTVPGGMSAAQAAYFYKTQPITIQSQFAEVIYFLRNNNLYRRVLLVAPDRQSSVQQFQGFRPGVFGGTPVSWQGVNDLSAHTSPTLPVAAQPNIILLNTLGDLTNRENRYASPVFLNDFGPNSSLDTGGLPDDSNIDTVPDYWPSLYPGAINAGLVNEPDPVTNRHLSPQYMPFPYVYQYAYSAPDTTVSPGLAGWIHTPDPALGQGSIPLLNALNHGPEDLGDSLPTPSGTQTSWMFPTWRETMSQNWVAPFSYNTAGSINPTPGLVAFDPTSTANANALSFLPYMTNALIPGTATPYRVVPQPFTDGAGSTHFAVSTLPAGTAADALWSQTWEDDLIMVGVRSFDVKAYDDAFPGYVDLGWANDGRLWDPYLSGQVDPLTNSAWAPRYLTNAPGTNSTNAPYAFFWPPNQLATVYDTAGIYGTFAHEGRMPPLVEDYRLDPQYPLTNVGDYSVIHGGTVPPTIRMRRTWDSWSTDYTNAPATGVVNPTLSGPIGGLNPGSPIGLGSPYYGSPTGSAPYYAQPIYPSYPAPYPQALRGLQIKITVVDPRNQRSKQLTIRQDFSDKL